MGLDISHDCWHGPYSAFFRFRKAVGVAAGLPLVRMDLGYKVEEGMPDPDGLPESDQLRKFLLHSDCDGEIAAEDCGPMADRLEQVLHALRSGPKDSNPNRGNWADELAQFIAGLREAASLGEPVEFH